jgi:hypothetical protein
MRDGDVRLALRRDLRVRHPEPETLLIDELDLGGLARIDLAAVNGEFWGYEIKSDRDTLRRLPLQVEVYSRVLDRAALVVTARHQAHVVDLLPDWWAIYAAREGPGGVELVLDRPGGRNLDVDPFQLVQLLWRGEVLDELALRGLDRGVRSKPRRVVWERLAESLELVDLQMVVRSRLKTRTGWRSDR